MPRIGPKWPNMKDDNMMDYKQGVQYILKLKDTDSNLPYDIAFPDIYRGKEVWAFYDYFLSKEEVDDLYIVIGEIEKIVDILHSHAARNPDGFPLIGSGN